MGNCMGVKQLSPQQSSAMAQIKQILSAQQIFILHLMFNDLANRMIVHKISLQNFLLFFHKNGFWGNRLFKEFDVDQSNLITEQEFIRGIAKIFKSSERDKISLLYKFFSKDGQQLEGVFFDEFLMMLYNYPKEDLKQILNDRDFIEYQLKKHLIPVENRKSDCVSETNLKQRLDAKTEKLVRDLNVYKLDDRLQSGALHSLIGKDVMRGIKKNYPFNETVIRLRDGDNFYDIRTINIQQLVKKFAKRIFLEAKIDIKHGRLNFQQFYNWISIHKALYQNYYDGFHNLIWEVDKTTRKPKYLTSPCDITSDAKMYYNNKLVVVKLYLQNSILVICLERTPALPIEVICLQGLNVQRKYESTHGFAISISHRDGIYDEKKMYFKNQKLLLEWMELLKFYKGASVHELYEIREKIGTGKFSLVYRCKNLAENKWYALKQIATFKLDQGARNLIAHESSIMQVISHPLLLEFKECIQTKTHIYIITELVDGKDLFEFVKNYEFLDEYDAAKITQQIIVGVRFLHSFDIVHRDLKPENIMIVVNEQSQEVHNIKIIDFGFSNYLSVLRELPAQDLLAGTPNYIAPQVLKEEGLGFKIDNFAIGAIIYFMLTGMLPFNDYTITDILKNTMKGEYKFSDKLTVSKDAVNLVDLLLKNDPNQRISLEQALKHPWFNILKEPRQKERKAKVQFKVQNCPYFK